jgi:N-acetylglucosamine-6-sulfatase
MDPRPRGLSGVFGWALSVWLCVSLGAAWASVSRLEPGWGLATPGSSSSHALGPALLLGPGPPAAVDVVPGLRVGVRPDILVITADDMRADDLRWMPHVRHELAALGISFRNSFTPNPLCCPARATFLTGKYSHNHGVVDVLFPYGFRAFDDTTTLATVLQRTGYRTALVGKYLNGYGTQRTHRDRRPSLAYVPPGWTQWWGSVKHTWDRGSWPGGGTYAYDHLTSNVNGRLRTWPGRYTTDVTAEQTQRLLRRFGEAQPQRPWFIWWTPVAPHAGDPVEADDPTVTRDRAGRETRWQTPARPDWVKGRFDATITHGAGTPPGRPAEPDVSDKPGYLRHEPELGPAGKRAVRDLTRQRAEALCVLDLRIGQTLAALRRSGQASRTIVVFNSDNGFYLGEHRKPQGKATLHEPSIRVPLIIRGPTIPHGVRYDPASMADLGVTVAAWAGTRLPHADGVDLRSTIRHGDQGWNRPLVIEGSMYQPRYVRGSFARQVTHGLDTVGFRTGRYVFIRYSTGESELYDLRSDPLELSSLNGSSAAPLRRELTRVWRRYVGCAGAECRAVLPRDLRTSPATTARIAQAQERARHRYYAY